MQSLITSYLLLNKECNLPGIGILQVIHTPASPDALNKLLVPPSEEIIFKKEFQSDSPSLVKYIADKKYLQQRDAKEMFNTFCSEWKEKIKNGEELNLETIGSLHTNSDGVIIFEKETKFEFLPSIPVNKIYQKEEAPILIKNASDVTEINAEENVVVEKSYWGLWALILFAIGSAVLFFHFKDHKFNGKNIGNQNHLIIDSAKDTYTVPKK